MTLRNVISGTKRGAMLEESVQNVIKLDEHNVVPDVINNGVIANENAITGLKELIHK